MSKQANRATCPHCCEGSLVWKRKTENVFGWTLRIYHCSLCGLESRRSELPPDARTINIYPGGIMDKK